MNVRALLAKNPVLALGSDRSLSEVARASEVTVHAPDEILIRAGSPQTHIFLVAEGRLELYRKNREAETQMLTGLIDAPAILGDAELYGRSPWIVSIRAVGEVTIVRIPNAVFDRLVANDGRIAVELYRETCARHLLAVEIMQVFALQKTQNKLLRLLLSFSRADPGESGRYVARISQVQLANALGLNPKTVRRHLAELARDGLITKDGDRITIMPIATQWTSLGAGFGASWGLAEAD